MIRCCWCEKEVVSYICPKCKRGFSGVCEKCHWESNHKPRDPHDHRFDSPKHIPLGNIDPAWRTEESPWQQNARRHLEDG